MVYQYKVNGIHKAPAQVAGEVCAALENSSVGLSPKTLLDASRDLNAPLHNEFEWDDSVAAEHYRESQAGAIIRNIYVVKAESNEESPKLRAFVNAKSNTRPGTYHNVHAALEDEDMKAQLLESAKRECNSFVFKYNTLVEMSDVIAEMRKVI